MPDLLFEEIQPIGLGTTQDYAHGLAEFAGHDFFVSCGDLPYMDLVVSHALFYRARRISCRPSLVCELLKLKLIARLMATPILKYSSGMFSVSSCLFCSLHTCT